MIDLTNVPEFAGIGGILTPGQYRAIIENAEPTTSKSGSAMLKVTFLVESNKIYEYIVLDPKNPKAFHTGLSKAKSILTAIGSIQTHFRNEIELADAMVGELMITIDIKQEEYLGIMKEKNIIKKYSSIPNKVSRPARPQRSAKDIRFDTSEIPF